MRERFAGPDLLLHLREDAAAEVFRRTHGAPAGVEREIASWIRTGFAREEDGLVVVTRAALEQLCNRPGPRTTLRDDAFLAALRRGDCREIARLALGVAEHLNREGRPAAAMAVLFEGAAAARRGGVGARTEIRILCDASATAVRTALASELDRALLLIQRASVSTPVARDLEEVVRSAIRYSDGRPQDALSSLESVCARAGHPDVLRTAWSVRLTVARAAGDKEERRAVRSMRRWVERTRPRAARSFVATAEGWLQYRRARFATAMRLHLEAARCAPDVHARTRCFLDAASAALECGDPQAVSIARRAQRSAASVRNPVHEGRSIQIMRSALLRSGRAGTPDLAFVEAAGRLGWPNLAASAAFTEAAIAWRTGDFAAARRLATSAAKTWSAAPPAAAARALAAAAGAVVDDGALARCVRVASRDLPPAVGIQVLALVRIARPAWRARLAGAARRLRVSATTRAARRIREVMSVVEARGHLAR